MDDSAAGIAHQIRLGIAAELRDRGVARDLQHEVFGRLIAEMRSARDGVWSDMLGAVRHDTLPCPPPEASQCSG